MDDVRSMMEDVVTRLKVFVEDEMRSCSMDFGCITPEYVQRAWGGRVAIEDIEVALEEVKCRLFLPSFCKKEAKNYDASLEA